MFRVLRKASSQPPENGDQMPSPPELPPTALSPDEALRRMRHAVPTPAGLIVDPSLLPRGFRVTVIGDIRIDIRGTLRDRRFQDIERDYQESGPVVTSLGGTAMGFTRAARPHFKGIHVIGALGQDVWTEYIRNRWCESGVDGCLEELPLPNSVVVVMRDRGIVDNPDGVRLLLADHDSPYQHLDSETVQECAPYIRSADALVVDGYALLGDSSAEALDTAVEIAVRAGVPICLDIVPHDIDRYLAMEHLMPFLVRSSLVTVEVHTLLRLLGKPAPPVKPTVADVAAIIDDLPRDLTGWQRTWFLRWGYGNMDETLAISPGHHKVYYRTGYAQSDPAGYGYRVAAAELKWWLTNYSRAASVYPDQADRGELISARRFRVEGIINP